MILNRPITGRTVLCAMVLFFGVIFAVNGTFLFFALSTWPGLTSSKSYEDGKKYNQLLDAAAQQKPLNWKSHAALDSTGNFTFELTDQKGLPVKGLDISATFKRPAHVDLDAQKNLEFLDGSAYVAKVPNIIPGLWRIEIRAMKNGQAVYFKIHEVLVGE